MSKNTNLHKAKKENNDEFYTQLVDIENELRHYKNHFKDKVVYCNCDDPYESNFVKYFLLNFNYLGLKRLIATCYGGSKFQPTKNDLWFVEESINERKPYKIDISFMPEDVYTLEDIEKRVLNRDNITLLDGDGDFRSTESINLLKECDIVVTNPPFSLFREYVNQLFTNIKKFLIIGNSNAITFKEIFPLIKDNKMWLGPSISSGDREFRVPDDYPLNAAGYRIDKGGNKYIRVKGVRWFTNLSHKKRNESIDLYKEYNEEEYPKYNNYDAIEVSKVAEIPKDYDGVMGVPITFLDKYNPEQFEIIDINPHFFSIVGQGLRKPKQLMLKGVGKKDPYARILIKRRKEK